MPDARNRLQKAVWNLIGPPLYYCEECKLAVKVTEKGVKRPCDCNAQIIAPRKAIAAGAGGLNMRDKARVTSWKIGASLTGRCV